MTKVFADWNNSPDFTVTPAQARAAAKRALDTFAELGDAANQAKMRGRRTLAAGLLVGFGGVGRDSEAAILES